MSKQEDHLVIPDAAVEAATKALSRGYASIRTIANRVIEAVAPHLMEQAWDEGAIAGWKQSGEGFNAEYPDESTGGCSVELTTNPYRARTAEPNFGCPDCGDVHWACDCRWKGSL